MRQESGKRLRPKCSTDGTGTQAGSPPVVPPASILSHLLSVPGTMPETTCLLNRSERELCSTVSASIGSRTTDFQTSYCLLRCHERLAWSVPQRSVFGSLLTLGVPLLDRRLHRCGVPSKSRWRRSSSATQRSTRGLCHCSTAACTAVVCRPSQDGGGRAVPHSDQHVGCATARPPPAPLWCAVQVKTAAVEQCHTAINTWAVPLLDRRLHRCGVPSKSRRRRSSSATQRSTRGLCHCSTAACTAVVCRPSQDGGGRAVPRSDQHVGGATARPPPAPLWCAVQVKTAAVEQCHTAINTLLGRYPVLYDYCCILLAGREKLSRQ